MNIYVNIYMICNYNIGTIPTELGNNIQLESLLLQGNQFTGGIPSQLGLATHMAQIVINSNSLIGNYVYIYIYVMIVIHCDYIYMYRNCTIITL